MVVHLQETSQLLMCIMFQPLNLEKSYSKQLMKIFYPVHSLVHHTIIICLRPSRTVHVHIPRSTGSQPSCSRIKMGKLSWVLISMSKTPNTTVIFFFLYIVLIFLVGVATTNLPFLFHSHHPVIPRPFTTTKKKLKGRN